MSDDWLQISDEEIDVADIMQQIRCRIAQRSGASNPPQSQDPVAVANELWQEMIEPQADELTLRQRVSLWQDDCDIIPHTYVIDWRIPILGPLHSVVRRLIKAEIDRYLRPSLLKQVRFNQQVLRELRNLARENALLHQEIEELKKSRQ